MKATKIVQNEKAPIIIILKTFYNKDHLSFLWENYKNGIYSKLFQYSNTLSQTHQISAIPEAVILIILKITPPEHVFWLH